MSYIPLSLCRGARCPRCGCQDTKITTTDQKSGGGWWNGSPDPEWMERVHAAGLGDGRPGEPTHSWRCGHCGLRFTASEPEPLPRPDPESAVPLPAPVLPQIAESHAAGNFIESLVVTATSESPGVRASKNLAPCSKCGGKMCVSSTRKKVRYLKCSGCGRTDKVAC